MMHPNRDDGVSVTAGNPTDDKKSFEIRSDPMDVAVDSRIPIEGNESTSVGGLGSDETKASGKGRKRKGVESLMKDLTMNNRGCIVKDTTGDKSMKVQKETVDFIRISPSSTKNTQNDSFQVGSSSRVTRSQRRKQIEIDRARMESELHPPNMGAQNTNSTHGAASGK
ncbi:hypothetical protein L6452_19220 [Arctium lappa]|uniref:Uncharacterized protein n=1 Tax=Arctium lappa TaxID=4217 RepID=A0ACB9B9U4_ARCLA|nr:hypothetical protein L6452_19220 [Arctium lappa]